MLHDNRRSEAENNRGEDQKKGWDHGQNLTVLREMQRLFLLVGAGGRPSFAALNWASTNCYDADLAFAAALFSRDLRRLAAFLWMTPRFAALSSAETRARLLSCLPSP